MIAPARDPARLLPAEPRTRAIAQDLYDRVAQRPIISPHGHVPVSMLAADRPFADPAELLVANDHYVTRLLHASGVELADLGVRSSAEPQTVWRLLADNWHLFAGTASGYWIDETLNTVFGLADRLQPHNADEYYRVIDAALATERFKPRALFERFRIEVLATTDDPLDDLRGHAQLQGDGLRVIPTFRPDAYIDPAGVDFVSSVSALLAATGQPTTFAGYLDAFRARREHFVRHGAVSADHGVEQPAAVELDSSEAERIFQATLVGRATAVEVQSFRAHMLLQMAGMSVGDGLVMTVHAGIHRNHSSATFARYGADVGCDIPVPTSFVAGMRPLLERYGLEPHLRLILFTTDETTFSRELAPLAGFYPSVYIGAPWWFLDAPDSINRYRQAVTETAGFYRGSGFIDDTRAFLSIPARHDMSRRTDSGYLATLVAQDRLSLASAQRIADDLVDAIPRRAFKL